jgi:hypothetical protein
MARRTQWEKTDAPAGYIHLGQPYRTWRNSNDHEVLLIECREYVPMHVDSGEWILLRRGKRIAAYGWYGRGLSKPPLTWANKQVASEQKG